MNNYKDLNVWVKGIEVAKEVYEISLKLPENVKFSYSSQIIKSSLSIPSNIAEGSGRATTKEYMRFLDIANGSCYELETQLILVRDIFKLDVESPLSKIIEIQKMLFVLKKTLKRKLD